MILKCYQCVAKHKLQRPKIAIADREQKPSRFAFRMSFLAQLIMRRAFLANCLCFLANACLPRSENYSIWGKSSGRWLESEKEEEARTLVAQMRSRASSSTIYRKDVCPWEKLCFQELRQNTNNYHHTSLFAGGLDARERLIASRSFIHNRFRWWTHLSYTTRCTICRFPGAF